jgi:hypothetical protein
LQQLGRIAPRECGGVFGNKMSAQTLLVMPGLDPRLSGSS